MKLCSNSMINVILVFVDLFLMMNIKKLTTYSLFFISFPSLLDFWRQFINVIASHDDLLIDEIGSYYIMILLPRTTDYLTRFV